jgi:hypothetical protein
MQFFQSAAGVTVSAKPCWDLVLTLGFAATSIGQQNAAPTSAVITYDGY